jgi:hypothetical protein
LDVTDKKPFDKADQTYVHNLSESTVLPLYDSKSMPLYNQSISWNRLKCDRSEEDRYKLLKGEE